MQISSVICCENCMNFHNEFYILEHESFWETVHKYTFTPALDFCLLIKKVAMTKFNLLRQYEVIFIGKHLKGVTKIPYIIRWI